MLEDGHAGAGAGAGMLMIGMNDTNPFAALTTEGVSSSEALACIGCGLGDIDEFGAGMGAVDSETPAVIGSSGNVLMLTPSTRVPSGMVVR